MPKASKVMLASFFPFCLKTIMVMIHNFVSSAKECLPCIVDLTAENL